MKKKETTRYSEVFKQKVVREVESGVLSMEQARIVYDIGGGSTIARWISEYGINERVGKKVLIMTKEEERENLILKRDLEIMKKALEDAQVKICILEVQVELAEKEMGVSLKKNYEFLSSMEVQKDLSLKKLKEELRESAKSSISALSPSTNPKKPLKRR